MTTATVESATTTPVSPRDTFRRRRRTRELIGKIAIYCGMGLIVVFCILPFYWMVVSALRQPTEGLSNELLPNPVSVQNFAGVFSGQNHFGAALLRSIIVATTATIVSLIIGIVCSYALARLHFPGKSLVLGLIISIAMFPTITLIVPLFKMFTGGYPWFPFHWIDTYQALILPSDRKSVV